MAIRVNGVMNRWLTAGTLGMFLSASAWLSMARGQAPDINDYPTSARAEYVFACMQTNGATQQALERCSCSIDVIASLLPYGRYVEAETVARMSQVPGNLGGMFKETAIARQATDDLRRAQAEAEVRCF
jgi:hypothetical protein